MTCMPIEEGNVTEETALVEGVGYEFNLTLGKKTMCGRHPAGLIGPSVYSAAVHGRGTRGGRSVQNWT